MQKAPVLKSSDLAPIDDEPVHVFGRNLEDRVVETKEDDNSNKEQTDEKRHVEDDVETIKKRKFETITGEEDEETTFQGEFKLFIWDYSQLNWIEKGRGQLKLNDSLNIDEKKSRLIMRAGGTYRIILNVAIQHSLFRILANTKTSIRFTDSQNVWAASGSNAKHLGDLIQDRLESAASRTHEAEKRTKTCDDDKDAQTRVPSDVTNNDEVGVVADLKENSTKDSDLENSPDHDGTESLAKDEPVKSRDIEDNQDTSDEAKPHAPQRSRSCSLQSESEPELEPEPKERNSKDEIVVEHGDKDKGDSVKEKE